MGKGGEEDGGNEGGRDKGEEQQKGKGGKRKDIIEGIE